MSERRRPGASREAFVRATGKLLRRQGYGATGINEIVAASGAPKGSLYFHFPGGKEGLAVAAMTSEGQRLRDAIAALLRSHSDVVEAVARVIDALAAGLEQSNFKDGCPLATVALEQATQSEAVRDAAVSGFNSWLEQIEQRLLDAGVPTNPCRAQGAPLAVRDRGRAHPRPRAPQRLTPRRRPRGAAVDPNLITRSRSSLSPELLRDPGVTDDRIRLGTRVAHATASATCGRPGRGPSFPRGLARLPQCRLGPL